MASNKIKFRQFYEGNSMATTQLEEWLQKNPYVKIVKWQAVTSGCRFVIVVQYEEV